MKTQCPIRRLETHVLYMPGMVKYVDEYRKVDEMEIDTQGVPDQIQKEEVFFSGRGMIQIEQGQHAFPHEICFIIEGATDVKDAFSKFDEYAQKHMQMMREAQQSAHGDIQMPDMNDLVNFG